MKLVYHETDKAEQSPLRKSPEDVQNKFSQLCFPIDFPTLSGKDKETALTILILISSLNEPLAESIEKIKAERVASATNTIFEFTK